MLYLSSKGSRHAPVLFIKEMKHTDNDGWTEVNLSLAS